jgi:hypothetical protein
MEQQQHEQQQQRQRRSRRARGGTRADERARLLALSRQ